jgi:hypothetical protein
VTEVQRTEMHMQHMHTQIWEHHEHPFFNPSASLSKTAQLPVLSPYCLAWQRSNTNMTQQKKIIFQNSLWACSFFFWPALWSSGQSFWLQFQRSWVRFLALPDFLRCRGSGTGSTEPREDNWGATWMKK